MPFRIWEERAYDASACVVSAIRLFFFAGGAASESFPLSSKDKPRAFPSPLDSPLFV